MNRRTFLAAGVAASLTSVHRVSAQSATGSPTFVLVHGAWHGGWCWSRVLPTMREAGSRVTAPTLTGLGERAHLIDRHVDLETHVTDITRHIQYEELSDVILVAHSYAGFPATIAASRLGSVVSHLVLLDSYFPQNGESILDHLGPDYANDINAKAAADPDWNMPTLPAAAFGLTGEDAQWVDRHLTPHPVATHTQAARYDAADLPRRTYLRCTESTIAPIFQKSLESVEADGQFDMMDIASGHDIMVEKPGLLAEKLLALRG